MSGRGRLELTWVGKDQRPRLEPRILLEDPAESYRGAKAGVTDNLLIHGDNLLALKALEAEYAGKVKCIFIDPPYNTGSAFTHYDDGMEHSLWLSMMRDRLELLRALLTIDGSIWISIDDNEAHYLRVLCDEVFGRSCFAASITWRSTDNSNNDAKQFSVDHNYIVVYGREPTWQPRRLSDPSKRGHFRNPDLDPRGAWFDGNPLNSPKPRPNLMFDLTGPRGDLIPHPPNGWRWSKETLLNKLASGEIRFAPDGRSIRRRTYLADMEGLPPSTVWADLERTGHNRQAKYELKGLFPSLPSSAVFPTPKPERLMSRVLELATNPGDLVLDSFAGSGTTGAVAHKMGRRWIMVEMGEHCRTHIVPRLKKVIDGADPGGVTEMTGWSGGGGFRFLRLAPSLMEKDQWGRWIINRAYRPEMVAEAICRLEGFAYAPSATVWWQHGSVGDRSFLYVTTESMTHEQLTVLSAEVGAERTLLVCCAAYDAGDDEFANLQFRKLPNAVLSRCEWSRDDYSVPLAERPVDEEPTDDEPATTPTAPLPKRPRGRPKARPAAPAAQGGLFGDDEGDGR